MNICIFVFNNSFSKDIYTKFMVFKTQEYIENELGINVDIVLHRVRNTPYVKNEYNLKYNKLKKYDVIIYHPGYIQFFGGYYFDRFSRKIEFLNYNYNSLFLMITDDSSFKYINPLREVYNRKYNSNKPMKFLTKEDERNLYIPTIDEVNRFDNINIKYLLWSNSVKSVNKWLKINRNIEGINFDNVVKYIIEETKYIQNDYSDVERKYDVCLMYTTKDKFIKRKNVINPILNSKLNIVVYSNYIPDKYKEYNNITINKLFNYRDFYRVIRESYIIPVFTDDLQNNTMLVWKYFDIINGGSIPVIQNKYDTNHILIPKELHNILYYDNFYEIEERIDYIKENIDDISKSLTYYITNNNINFKKDKEYPHLISFLKNYKN